MKLFLFATFLLVAFLQNEVSAKSHEAAKRDTDAEEEGHLEPTKVDVNLKSKERLIMMIWLSLNMMTLKRRRQMMPRRSPHFGTEEEEAEGDAHIMNDACTSLAVALTVAVLVFTNLSDKAQKHDFIMQLAALL